jgi:Putative phage serine protease XkdF
MARRIKKAKISFVSLVSRGANNLPVIYKSADNSLSLQTLSKLDDQGELLAVVYAPEMRDTQGDIASAEVIKDAAYGFLAGEGGVDIMHDGRKLEPKDAFVAESFIVQKGDARFSGWTDLDGNAVELAGSWATVIKIENPELRRLYREGKWNGVSMGGTAVVEEDKSNKIDKFVEAFLDTFKDKEKQMTPTELEAAIAKANAPVLTALTGLVEALTKKQEQPKPEQKLEAKKAPAYTGKPDDDVALAKHARALELHALQVEADLNSAEGIATYRAALAELKKKHADEDAELRKSKSTNQPEEGDESAPEAGTLLMKKSDRDLMAAGRELFAKKKGA